MEEMVGGMIAYSIIQTSDGGYIVAGVYSSFERTRFGCFSYKIRF